MTQRPPWFGPKEQMVQWVHGKLDELLKELHLKPRDEASKRRYADWVEGYGPELEAAEQGDID